MRKLVIVCAFFSLAPLTLILVFLAGYFKLTSPSGMLSLLNTQTNYKLFQSIPDMRREHEIIAKTYAIDARTVLLKKFFSKYSSPLEKQADFIVYQADKYSIDYRLIPAISMQESTGCKFIPDNSFNCWGYGIYGDKVTRFSGYEEAIETVSRGLRKNYYEKGLTTPQAIMHKYTPPSIALGGPWASGVEYFFDDIEKAENR
jgi:hypothetical protein